MGGDAAERIEREKLMLHFAYGANMHRAVMRKHAPEAQPLGIAQLAHHRFIITTDGYASVVPVPGTAVHGMLWRLTPRDRATLDLWENVAGGLYTAAMRPVRLGGGQRIALVYVARPRPLGAPKTGYMEIVVAAAKELELPATYIASLEQWLPARSAAAGHRKLAGFDDPEKFA
jgi:hypothetical protein